MAILSKVLMHPQERYDLESFEQGQIDLQTDAKFWTKQFMSELAYILKGFEVSGLNAPSPCTVSLTDATLVNANNTGNFSWYSAPNAASPLSVTLQPGQRNYLELELATVDGTPLTRAFWDPSADGGNGAEFQQIVDTIQDLDISVQVSTVSFSGSANRIPLAIIDTDGSNVVKLILDKRPLFFRLGTPANASNNFNWLSQLEPAGTLVLSGVSGSFQAGETITFSGGATAVVQSGTSTPLLIDRISSNSLAVGNTVTGGNSGATGTVVTLSESFTGADKNIKNFKHALDATMTEVKRLKGTNFWFESGFGSILGSMRFINSLLVQNTSAAYIGWDGTNVRISDSSGTPANADVIGRIRIFGYTGNLDLTRQDGTGGSSLIPLSDGQVLYVELPSSGNRAYSGVGAGSTNYKTIARASFVINDSNYWLAYREGSKIYVRGMGELESGEEGEIGDQLPGDLLTALGLSENDPTPNYTSDLRGVAGESFLNRISTLTNLIGDEQEDRSAFFRSGDPVIWTGTQFQWTSQIEFVCLNSKGGGTYTNTFSTGSSPLTINNNESVYFHLTRGNFANSFIRSSITPIPAQSQANRDVIVFAHRIDVAGQAYLFLPFHKQLLRPGQSTFLGASGSGSGLIKVDYHDPLSSTLPSGPTVTIDGQAGVNGDLVLFTNLSSGNNRVYQLSGVGVSIAWTAQFSFESGLDPSDGELIVVKKGDGFADQLGKYTGTAWQFNKTTRYFDGANYVEFESMKTATITANTTDNIFTVAASNSNNWVIFYSIIRASEKIVGTIWLTHDGTEVFRTIGGTDSADLGIDLFGDINAGNLRLRYTADNSGPNATIKYFFYRWSDSTGGPGGVPNYSGISSTPVTAAGNTGDIQFKDSGGGLAANGKLNWDNSAEELNMNGRRQNTLSSGIPLNNAQGSPSTLISYNATTYPFAIIKFSIVRGTKYRCGQIYMPTNGISASGFVVEDSDPDGSGIILTATISGGNVLIQYISDNQGIGGTFKYWMDKWS